MDFKYIAEYRDTDLIRRYIDKLTEINPKPWNIMEVCGGQTHAIIKHGIDQLIPSQITLLHGPGCPVCVTPISIIDAAIELASKSNVIFCSFGDMLRVPGTKQDLQQIKAQGGDIRVVYSPLDALALAKADPQKEVVFFAVGFETTAPTNALAVWQAKQQAVKNFSLLVSQVLVPPALEVLLSNKQNIINGFLAPGHVCTITGYTAYEALVAKYKRPIVVTGFEPVDILQGLLMCIKQLEKDQATVENQYTRSVQKTGNQTAQAILAKVFSVDSKEWRGLGEIADSGLHLAAAYREFDAIERFALNIAPKLVTENKCISGLVLQGLKKPIDCPEFAKSCCPESPLGATMVSTEGACAAYYSYRNLEIVN